MIALYPIKPIYTDRIMSGEKKFELRKRLPSVDVDYIIIYSTFPASKVVGYAKIKKYHSSSIENIWNLVHEQAGIDYGSYNKYFINSTVACAIEFDEVFKFIRPFGISEISKGITVPQSFCYVGEDVFSRLKRRKVLQI